MILFCFASGIYRNILKGCVSLYGLKFKEKSRGRGGDFTWQGTKGRVSFVLSEERLEELDGCQAEIDEFVNVWIEKATLCS